MGVSCLQYLLGIVPRHVYQPPKEHRTPRGTFFKPNERQLASSGLLSASTPAAAKADAREAAAAAVPHGSGAGTENGILQKGGSMEAAQPEADNAAHADDDPGIEPVRGGRRLPRAKPAAVRLPIRMVVSSYHQLSLSHDPHILRVLAEG